MLSKQIEKHLKKLLHTCRRQTNKRVKLAVNFFDIQNDLKLSEVLVFDKCCLCSVKGAIDRFSKTALYRHSRQPSVSYAGG